MPQQIVDEKKARQHRKMIKAIQDIRDKFKVKKSDEPGSGSTTSSAPPSPRRVDHLVTDPNTNTVYVRGKVLGRGGFATCYEFINTKTRESFAGKVMAKKNFLKTHQKLRIAREVEIHKSMRHKNIVSFHGYFEDNDNVYILLELCTNKSLSQLLKQRRALPEPEVRYFVRQLMEGCKYIHGNRVIHRDIKLGNLLLDANMELKICDFGLATNVRYEGEMKQTVCGTPNYISPEVLTGRGHSYEADVWSIGCVMYTLLVGTPPFETNSVEETYQRIRTGTYYIPGHVSMAARTLLQRLLCVDPQKRPSVERAMNDRFFAGYTPKTVFPLVDHLLEGQGRKGHHRQTKGKSQSKVKRKKSQGDISGRVPSHELIETNNNNNNNNNNNHNGQDSTCKSYISRKHENVERDKTTNTSNSCIERSSGDDNKENKTGVTGNTTTLSLTRNDADDIIKNPRASDAVSVAPLDKCISFVDKSMAAVDYVSKSDALPYPIPALKDNDTSSRSSPSNVEEDIKEEIARYEDSHKSAFTSIACSRLRGCRRRVTSPAVHIASRPNMEDIYEVSSSFMPSASQADAPRDPEVSNPQSVHAYDAVWPKDGLDLDQGQNEGEEDDVMTEEEERAAMLGARQHRRSSVAKMVLLCSLSEENADENQASPPPSPSPCPRGQGHGLLLQSPAAEKPAPSQMFTIEDDDAVCHNRASAKLTRADVQAGGLSDSKQQTVEQSATVTPAVTLTRSSSVDDTLPSDVVVSPPQTESRTQKSLRKTRSVSVFPTQTLEQMIGQLCAERYAQGKLAPPQAPVCTLEQRTSHHLQAPEVKSSLLSPVDTQSSSTKGSPAPVRRRQANVGKGRRHTALGINEDEIPTTHGGKGVLILPGVDGTSSSSSFRKQHCSTPGPERTCDQLPEPVVPRSVSVTPTGSRRKDKLFDKQRRKSARDLVASTCQEVNDPADKGSRSSTSKVTSNKFSITTSPSRSQTPTDAVDCIQTQVEATNGQTLPRKKKNSRRYSSVDTIPQNQVFESALLASHQVPGVRDEDNTQDTSSSPVSVGQPKWSALSMYDALNKCIEQNKVVDAVRPMSGERTAVFVSKWVDYSNKYGFGFQMSDGCVGVLFNNRSWMTLSATGRYLHYHDAENNTDQRCQSSAIPAELKKKASLVSYFARYMDTYLSLSERCQTPVTPVTGALAGALTGADNENVVAVKKWHRTKNTVAMYLSNGALQVNSLDDHTKIIITPHSHLANEYIVSLVSRQREVEHFSLLRLLRVGCTPQLSAKLTLARDMLAPIIGFKEEAV